VQPCNQAKPIKTPRAENTSSRRLVAFLLRNEHGEVEWDGVPPIIHPREARSDVVYGALAERRDRVESEVHADEQARDGYCKNANQRLRMLKLWQAFPVQGDKTVSGVA
jgi:hypothetical protein